MARVVLEKLTKTFPEKSGSGIRAVNGVDLAVEDGEFMVIVGPSGCGKSTVLRLVAGLEDATSGSILIDGRPMNAVLPKDRDIAMVFQNYALYPHLSVYENLAFGLRLRKRPKREIDERVRAAAALLGLEACLERKPKTLSGGQRQRVAVGRAIVRHPKVFLFDEPLSNLDAQMRVGMRAELSKLHERLGATMIYVTHDQVEAMTMGDRVCVMSGGEVQQVAEPLEVYRNPANRFVAGFIGSPPMNFFPGTVRGAGPEARFVASVDSGLALALALPPKLAAKASSHGSRPVVLGIRPEDISEAGETADRGSTAEAAVEIVEMMGAESCLHLRAGGAAFVARVRSDGRVKAGQKLGVCFDLAQAHLFDAETAVRL